MVGIGREKADLRFAQGYSEAIGEVEEPEQEEDESALELQNGRGEAMGAQRYAVKSDIVKNLTAHSIDTFRDLSTRWHEFLGLVARPSRKRRASDGGETSLDRGGAGWRRGFDVTSPAARSFEPESLPRASIERWNSSSTLATISPDGAGREKEKEKDRERERERERVGLNSLVPTSVLTSPPTPCLTLKSYSLDQARQKMGQLFGGSGTTVQFRSPAQEAGLAAVLRQETPLVVVLPTGGGKTLLAQIPALLEPKGVSIMVIPFRALIEDMVRRFQAAQIACLEWHAGETNPATIVLVSADVAVTSGFMVYARTLRENGSLRRIFFDECHTTFKDNHWRDKLDRVRQLRALGCQTVCLTATLPPALVYELERSMAISHARIIRDSTTRAQHRYLVQRCRPGELQSQVISICQRRGRHLGRGEKAVVYGKSRLLCEQLAEELQCLHYHSQVDDRAQQLATWVAEGGFIVTTSALGTGIDFPGIVFVLHVDMPWSMIDFAQESGRGGRGGRWGDDVVDSVILVPEKVVEARMEKCRSVLTPDTSAMAEFITTTDCRRLSMSRYLDGDAYAVRCGQLAGAAQCDRCGEGLTEIQAQQRREAREWREVRSWLDDLSQSCVYCWVTQKKGMYTGHEARQCVRHPEIVEAHVQQLRGAIVYLHDSHSCWKCGISQRLCATGEDSRAACQWHHIVVPMVYVITGNPEGRQIIRQLGFTTISDQTIDSWSRSEVQQYGSWLGQRHIRRIWGHNMSNAMALLIQVILYVGEPNRTPGSGRSQGE